MSDVVFFIKLFCLTIALVIVMQIQVGDRSLELHALSWVQSSAIVSPLNTVARGGAKIVRDISTKVHGFIDKNVGKKQKEEKPQASSFRWSHTRKEQAKDSDSSSD